MTQSKLMVAQKTLVVPGEELAEGLDFLPSFGTYRQGDFIRADRVGLVQVEGKVIKLVPMRGYYTPRRGDTVIGRVEEILVMGWRFQIGTTYLAMLGLKDATSDFINRGADLTQYFNLGDVVVTRIANVAGQKLIDLTMRGPGLRKLQGGRLFEVNPYKVPRIIGKRGSMISMIKQATGCNLIVGQNGTLWISGQPEQETIAVDVIRKIEREAHLSGLTETIKVYLEEKTGKKVVITEGPSEDGVEYDNNNQF